MPQGDNVGRINAFRPKIFLADLEFAKKEELQRRRKLRLKQVRQQARDIAAIIRAQTGDARKRAEEWSKQVQYQSAVKSSENSQKELQEKLLESLSSVGAAHSSATILSEVDQLLQHRAELQDTLARVRAELAVEKTKEPHKQRSEIVQCPREGISIAKVSNSKPQMKPSVKRILTPKLKTGSRTIPPTPPNFMDENLPSYRAENEMPKVLEKTIFSPPSLTSSRATKLTEKRTEVSSRSDGRKSCPPTTEFIDADVSCDSDDSGQTWPPASVKKKKSSKVRMYDHSAKRCSEYVQQCGVVRLDDPEPHDMKELIQEEEDLMSKKTEEELESRQVDLQRGLKALREEIAKKDFDDTMRGLRQSSKEKRLRKALAYPNVPSGDAPLVLGSRPSQSSSSRAAPQETGQGDLKAPEPGKHRPPVTVPDDPLSAIVTSLNERRENILNEGSRIEESSDVDTGESSEDESQLPLWLRKEFEAQNNREAAPETVTTPKTVMSTLGDDKSGRRDGLARKESHHELTSSSITATDDNGQSSQSPKAESSASESSKGPRKRVGFLPDAPTQLSRTDESSSSGINVQIKITKDNSPSKRSSLQTPQKSSDSSSYYSPPNKLSPAQVSVLNDILSKVSIKNRNPVLHYYITRVLDMSHQSVSDLDVSTGSDFSIQTDLFPKSKQSTPQKPKKPWCLEEADNLSTLVSVASTPRAPSSSGSSQDYCAQIAQLLNNMMDLQRMRNSQSTTESSAPSSYKGVPGKMSVESGFRAGLRDGVHYGEDTGIFESSRGNGLSDRPSYLPHFSGENVRIDVPSHLLPRPGQTAGSGRSKEGHLDFVRRIMDVPDGYSMKPEEHPVAVTVTSGDVQRAIHRLSDIESVVSSIQSTPTKKRRRPTSPTGSLPASDAASVMSGIASSDFISSAEMLNNDLIGSSSSDFEDVFRSLGIGWALSTLRRTRNSRNLPADDSSSKTGDSAPTVTSSDKSASGSTYRHSTPVKNSAVRRKSPEIDAVPSLTPPNISLQCPNLLK